MCDICNCTPCMSGCPNESEPPSVFVCSCCGEDIYDGDEYWDIFGEQVCEECIDDARRIAEYDPF